MLHGDWLAIVSQLFFYGGWLVAAATIGLMKGKNMDKNEVSRNDVSRSDVSRRDLEEQERLDRRRKQGGVYFNDILYDMRGREERLIQSVRDRAFSDNPGMDREFLKAVHQVCEENLRAIERMLRMRDSDDAAT